MLQGDASYEFGYDIHNPLSNDIKSHHEVRDGKNVQGFYTFKEADGTIRIVKYKVTPDTGFEAVVEKVKPESISGNSIDGQEASPTSHGAPDTINEPNGGHRSQYVAGIADSLHGGHVITAGRNPQGNVPEPQRVPAQNYANSNPTVEDNRQRKVQEPQQHQPNGRYRNSYILPRNPRFRNDQQSQLFILNGRPQNVQYPLQNNHDQKLVQETRYVDIPRGRQRNPYIDHRQSNQVQLQLKERARPRIHQGHRNHYTAPPQGQVQPYVNNVQPNPYGSGKIVYIDGVAYIDDIGLYSDPPGQNGNVQDRNNGQNPQYEVVENPESNVSDEAASNAENTEEPENEEDKEDYEEDDEEDEDNADFEEEDENDDEDADATDFYEENEQLFNEKKKEYDKLKKAYENDDDRELKPKQKKTDVKKSQPVQEE